jgi:2-phospho-L-lactate transferase/gluconeogenesis factor (CofD/UPF0052 family)
MTKCGQTTKYKTSDHIRDLEQYLGVDVLDIVLINTKHPSEKALEKYKKFFEETVEDDLRNEVFKIVKQDLVKDELIKKNKADAYRRSIIRHDPIKLAKAILKLIDE